MRRKGGAELELIRDWLGHASISQTVLYNSFAPDDDYDAPKVAKAAQLPTAELTVVPLRAAC